MLPMSLEKVLMNTCMLNKLDATCMSQRFDHLQADVDSLKTARERTNATRRSRGWRTSCMWSVSNEVRRCTQSRYKLPRVEATRTPHLDHFMHTLAPQTATVVGRELSRIQMFVLDFLAPLTTILDNNTEMSIEEVKEASSAPAQVS